MNDTSPPRLFDRDRLRVRRNAAAAGYDDYAFLKDRVSRDLAARLDDTTRRFDRALDLGAHDGRLARRLSASGRVGDVVALECAEGMARQALQSGVQAVVGEEAAAPFKDGVFDVVASALSLHWVDDLPGAFALTRRMLKPDGLFLGAVFGAGTLKELRSCLIEAETEITGGATARVAPLPALQDMGGLLQRAGFALPVADIEPLIVRYRHPFKLLEDLKGMAERSILRVQTEIGLSRRILTRMADLYAERYAEADGKVRATFNVIHVSGWAPAPGQPTPLRPGSAKASLAAAVKGAGEPSN